MSRMIRVEAGAIGRGTAPLAPPMAPAGESPSTWDVVKSAFALENDVVAAIDFMSRPQFEFDPDFDPMGLIGGTKYESLYLDRFVGVGSEAEARQVMSRIDREEKHREVLARGGFRGFLAGVAAGTLSPTVLIPVGGWLGATVRGGRAARGAVRAAEAAAITSGSVALQEGVLQAAQETRTTTESLFAIGGAAILGGVLGGAAGFLTRTEFDTLAKSLDRIPATRAEEEAAFKQAMDLSAAASDSARAGGELKGTGGAARVVGNIRVGDRIIGQDPLLRLQTSPIQAARNTVRDLAETPLTLAENADGIATTVGGAVETRIKMAQGPLAFALRDMDNLYSQYFFGAPKRFAAARGTAAVLMGRGGGKLNYVRFKEAVFDALLAGDVHGVAEVQAAAKALRAKVFEPWKKAAVEAGLFADDIKPLDDIGYVPRVYDTEVIRARRTEFTGILARHFEARQQELLDRAADLEARTGAEGIDPAIRDLTPAEIRSLADEVTDTILANSPARVLTPADLVAGPRGPLKERVLRIPTTLIRDFVERDPEVLARKYVHTMSADVGLVKKFGSTDMTDAINKINDEANARIAAAAGEKERKAFDAQRRAAIRDLTAIRDRIRGTYALPDNPDGLLVRAGRVIRNLNYVRLLGGMTPSAIPDLGRVVMVNGLTRTLGTAFAPLTRGLRTFKLAAKEAKLAGTALDMILDTRAMAIADIMDDYGRGSKFERAVSQGTRSFGVVSLMAPWNAAIKQFVGIVGQTRMLQAIERLVAGKASKKEIEYLAAGGIDANMAERIAAQFEKGGVKDGPVWWANTEAWSDQRAVESFRAFMVREIDRTIVTPGQDKPLWMSTEMGKIIGQFRSFNIASMQRTVLAGLQQRDAAALNGAILMLALGALSYKIKMDAGGYEVSDDPVVWATEAFDRSGLTGWLTDANNIAEKVTRGRVGLSAFTGEQASRYASRNALGALLGPTFDATADAIQIVGSAAAGDWTAADSHAFRKMIPIQNLFYLRQLFDAAEAGTNEALGIPARKPRK